MPSRADRLQLCIFGDSHIGCLKQALRDGLVAPSGTEISFFGADGPRFRMLQLQDGRIVPDPEALETVRMISGGQRDTLGPGEFDALLLVGMRIRTGEYFAARLSRVTRPGGFLSAAAGRAEAANWLRKHRFYQYALAFRAAGQGGLILQATSFPTAGIGPDPLADHPGARQADGEARADIWAELEELAAEDGITLLAQPDHTVIDGCLTHPDWARPGAAGARDPVHRSASYGALVLEQALAALRHPAAMAAQPMRA